MTEYQMGYRADEFASVLNGAFTGDRSLYNCTAEGENHWVVTHQQADFRLDIQVAEQAVRKLGMIAIPVLQVRFEQLTGSEAQQQEFLARFHQYFHKGGG